MKFIHASPFCQSCGENVSKEIAFCRNCGTALSEEQVQKSIDQSRAHSTSAILHKTNAAIPQRITGAIVIGLLEFLLVVMVFTASTMLSMNFFPDGSSQSDSFLTYFIIMTTACVAGLSGGSYLSRKFCEKYPEKIAAFKRSFNCEKVSQ